MGWVKLNRSIRDSEIFCNEQLLRLWIICLTEATYKECSQRVGSQTVHLVPGEFVTGRFEIQEIYNNGLKPSAKVKGEKTVYRWLEKLEELGCVTIKKTTKYSVISIVNWSEYQQNDQQKNDHQNDHSNDHQNDQQKVNNTNGLSDIFEKVDHQNDHSNVREMTTKEEVKEIKNKNIMSSKHDRAYPFDEIISYLNSICGTNFKTNTKATQSLIKARYKEGYELDDFKRVIDIKAAEWLNTDMQQYLRPQTLFSPKFESYLNQRVIGKASGTTPVSKVQLLQLNMDED